MITLLLTLLYFSSIVLIHIFYICKYVQREEGSPSIFITKQELHRPNVSRYDPTLSGLYTCMIDTDDEVLHPIAIWIPIINTIIACILLLYCLFLILKNTIGNIKII